MCSPLGLRRNDERMCKMIATWKFFRRALPGCLHGRMRCCKAMPLVMSESRLAFEPGPPFPYTLSVTALPSQVTCFRSSCNKPAAPSEEGVAEGIGQVSISHHTRIAPSARPMRLCGSSRLFSVGNDGEVLSDSSPDLQALMESSKVFRSCSDIARVNLKP